MKLVRFLILLSSLGSAQANCTDAVAIALENYNKNLPKDLIQRTRTTRIRERLLTRGQITRQNVYRWSSQSSKDEKIEEYALELEEYGYDTALEKLSTDESLSCMQDIAFVSICTGGIAGDLELSPFEAQRYR